MTVEVLTFGCRLNAHESEVMRAHAAALTDTVIVNTCAVTEEAERQARRRSAARIGKIQMPASLSRVAPRRSRLAPGRRCRA